MRRIPEPELMLDEEQVRAYADADFDAPHSHFMELLGARFDRLPQTGLALDLGCGAGDISRRYAAMFPGWQIDAVDGSATMLAAARERTPESALIRYTAVHLPAAPTGRYDMIFQTACCIISPIRMCCGRRFATGRTADAGYLSWTC